MNKQKQNNSNDWSFEPLAKNTGAFETSDLGLAAFLLTAEYELITMRRDYSNKAYFLFKKEVGIEGASDRYFAGNAQVGARAYFDNVRNLKNMLYLY